MGYRTRIYYTDSDKALMWDRWQKGDSMHAIARLFDQGHSSIQRIFSDAGGIRPRQRSRSRLALTLNDRSRNTLGFCSPAEKFNECIASIHCDHQDIGAIEFADFAHKKARYKTGLKIFGSGGRI
jgi:hypothetical protein